LASSTYAGTHVFNKENSKTRKTKDKAEWVKVSVPAIISQEQFDIATRFRDALTPMKSVPRRETSPNLLTGLLKCDCCGSTMIAVTSGKGEEYRYYKCASRMSKGNTACKSNAVRMDTLDNMIVGAFHKTIYTPEYIRDVIDTYRKHTNRQGGEDRQRTKKLEAELKEIEQAEAKLFEAIEKGVLELDDRLKGRVQQHKTRRETITAELAALQRTQQTPFQTITPQKIDAVARTMNKRFSVSTPFSRAYIKATLSEIRFTGDRLKLRGEPRTLANLIAAGGQIDPTAEVRRFIPVWRPLRDSNPCYYRERVMS
jgi:site-specific DNA recombinase